MATIALKVISVLCAPTDVKQQEGDDVHVEGTKETTMTPGFSPISLIICVGGGHANNDLVSIMELYTLDDGQVTHPLAAKRPYVESNRVTLQGVFLFLQRGGGNLLGM